MNNILDLFRGIGVIIDDDLNPKKVNRNDSILKIKQSFINNNIPILEYYELPDEKVANFHSISFLLLDWDLIGLEPGISLPEAAINDNIAFIKQFNSVCFAPIFIFSNESVSNIQQELSLAGLYDETKSNHIFIESKSKLRSSKSIFSKITKWIKKTPSIYVLREWENSLQNAKRDLFWDFYQVNPNWPKIIQQSYKNDGVDGDYELGSLIQKNLSARTLSASFDESIINRRVKKVSKKELRNILECERFLSNKSLPDYPSFGDIFKEEDTNTGKVKYWVNIRPDCDTIRKSNPDLYCLKGIVIDEDVINKKHKKGIKFNYGTFEEKIVHAFVSFIDGGKIIEVKFQDLKVCTWNQMKSKRIGKLLPPYITRLQQKYIFYLQRQGVPAIPPKAIL